MDNDREILANALVKIEDLCDNAGANSAFADAIWALIQDPELRSAIRRNAVLEKVYPE